VFRIAGPAATPPRHGCCSASGSPASSAQTAGAATTTSIPAGGSSAGAHLLRDFTAHSEGLSEQKAFGTDGLQTAHELFNAWDAYQHDGDRTRLQAQTAPLQAKLRAMLEHAARKSPRTKYHRVFAKNLLNRWPALSGPSPTATGSSRPTTTPNAACAAPRIVWTAKPSGSGRSADCGAEGDRCIPMPTCG
jgi:hypothetical protein